MDRKDVSHIQKRIESLRANKKKPLKWYTCVFQRNAAMNEVHDYLHVLIFIHIQFPIFHFKFKLLFSKLVTNFVSLSKYILYFSTLSIFEFTWSVMEKCSQFYFLKYWKVLKKSNFLIFYFLKVYTFENSLLRCVI